MKNFLVRILLCLVCLSFSSPSLAQWANPELRPVPQPEIALWSTIYSTSNGLTFVLASSPDEACRLQWQSFQPQAEYRPPIYQSEVSWRCDFSVGVVSAATNVQAYCPEGRAVRNGLCVIEKTTSPPIWNGECGSSPISGTPQPNKGNPINVNSGLKVQADVDYATADGLFSVDRQYLSRAGHGWQLLLPGYLEMGDAYQHVITYYSRGGGRDEFVSTNFQDDNNWAFTSPTTDYSEKPSRRRVAMVNTPTTNRYVFASDTNISPTGAAEVRLDMVNGEYILFRRANGAPSASGGRRLVPIEQGKVGGYKIFYDYNDAG
jgi:hypothetical protein